MINFLTHLIILIVAVVTVGCGDEEPRVETFIIQKQNPDVVDFSISPCMESCRLDFGKILEQSFDGNQLQIKLGHWFDCSIEDNLMGDFEYTDEVLNLKPYKLYYTIENNDTLFYSYAEACYCSYEIEFKVNIKEQPLKLRINNEIIENFKGVEEF